MKLLKIIICFTITASAYSAFGANDTKSTYERAIDAFNSGNYGSSELLFRKVIDSGDDEFREESLYHLARSIFQQKKYKSAIFEFNRYLNICRDTNLCLESRYWIGESFFYQNDFPKAIEEYKRYISRSKTGIYISSAHDRIGSIYFNQERYDESVIEWKSAIEKCPDRNKNSERLPRIGEALFRNGKYDEALSVLNPLLTSSADTKIVAQARIITGRIYQKKKNHKKAISVFNGIPESIMKEMPYCDVKFFMALSHLESGKLPTARNLLELFILIGKNSFYYNNALLELGKIYIRQGENEKGLKILQEVNNSAQDNNLKADTAEFLGQYYIREDPEKAILYLESVNKLDTKSEKKEIMMLLGEAYIRVRKFNEAGNIFGEFLKKFPYEIKDAEKVYFLQARIHLEKGEIDRAMDLFGRIKSEYPFSKYINESNYYLAFVHYHKEEYKKALGLLKSYVKDRKAENIHGAELLLINCYLKMKDLKNAGKLISKISRTDMAKNGTISTVYNYAIALSSGSKANSRKASKYFEQIIDNFPESQEAIRLYLKFGNDAFEKKNYNEAARFYGLFLSGNISADRGYAYYHRIVSMYELKKYNEVLEIIKNGNIPPLEEKHWINIPVILARCYYKIGNKEKSFQVFNGEQVKNLSGEDLLFFYRTSLETGNAGKAVALLENLKDHKSIYTESLFDLSLYYERIEDIRSEEVYQKILNEYPDSPEADLSRLKLAEKLFKNKKFQDSIALCRKVIDKKILHKSASLMMQNYLELRDTDEINLLLKKFRKKILDENGGMNLLRQVLDFYSADGNIRDFITYSKHYRDSGNEFNYINSNLGQMYYKTANYKKSFSSYKKIDNADSIDGELAHYYMGEISLFVFRKKKAALEYLTKIPDVKNENSIVKFKAMLLSAKIHHDLKNDDESKMILSSIIKNSSDSVIRHQAENLVMFYGYNNVTETVQ